ncbi:transglycosylase SLT domain-containing protein [Candidatus Tisiphia endosymbiont of Nemotelus uliginosus]|uniref:transglycosylase SLT domain-containing protein n=1 Tax=Candidatus Tisiphia endosymbiont of Nemotelus uliginosus TaxID=3077926 RepID=UPI0035C93DAF
MSSYATLDQEIAESHKCSRLFSYFEAKHTIPRNTLHSIALKESGKKHSIHNIVIVWPWTVNVAGQGYHFNTKREAILFVKKQIIRGKENINVGCMQINLKHHLDAFNSLSQAFEPKYNIAYSAKFLKAKYDQLGNWHKAIAHYHSSTHERGARYKQDVIKIANNMHLYQNAISLHNNNYYNKAVTYPATISKVTLIDNSSFKRNIKKYRSNMMVAIPSKYN